MPGLGTCSQTKARLHSQNARGLVEARIEAGEDERLLSDRHRVVSVGELHGVVSTQGEGVRKLAGLFHHRLGDLQDQQLGPASRGRVPAPFIGGMIAPCLWLPANWGSNIE